MDHGRLISNSEVTTWVTCQRRYYYTYDLKLRPKVYSAPLSRGLIGHEVLQAYYSALQSGASKSAAIQVAKSVMQTYGNSADFDLVFELSAILDNYWNMVDDSDWEILGVENQHELDLGWGANYVMRYDLLVRIKSLNQIAIVDHKFVYDFWSNDDVALSPQFPKYMACLRGLGIDVKRCILNQLRYRPIKKENQTVDKLFNRAVQIPTVAKMQNALMEQRNATMEILAHRELPIERRMEKTSANRNKITCRGCSVKELCLSQYDGGDVSYLIDTQFEVNEQYGYNNEIASEIESKF